MAKSEERIDKWLWAMRIFKTRTVATDSCKKGRVSVGPTADSSVIVKPSRLIKVGDIVHVRKPPVTYSFLVKALTENRLGARLVPDYMENITPQAQYDLLDVVRISGFIDRRKGLGRPTKREGRDLARFAEEVNDGWDFDDSSWEEDDSDSRYNFDFDEEDFI
ncbi:MAG: RNA-binding S4 domain-containing protein [Muribaculaceae bacterium]|nr:RNA-binding S4 domain-containing protein [Muribaculaceae bacterium]